MLQRIAPALRSACELRTLRQTELTLLDTYIGSATARRVLAGRVRRGQIETLEAALLLCDLRGFTELSNRLPGERVLALLDAYFDRVVPAITARQMAAHPLRLARLPRSARAAAIAVGPRPPQLPALRFLPLRGWGAI
jgi:class 3 adenylate cyclase